MKKFWFWITRKIFYSRAMRTHRVEYYEETLKWAGVKKDYNLAEKFADYE